MSRITVSTNLNIDLEFSIPGFHRRLLAWAIDFVIALIYVFTAFKVVRYLSADNPNFFDENGWSLMMLSLLPASLYPLLMEWLMQGQTMGKRVFNLKIINAEGGSASLGQYMIRWLMRVSDFMVLFVLFAVLSQDPSLMQAVGFFFLLLIADIICISMSKKSQRIGDLLAQTLLIEKEKAHRIDETIFMEVAEHYVPTYPEVMRLKDVEITRIKNIYDQAWKKQDYALAERVASRICEVLNIRFQNDAFAFIATLLKDYNHYAHGK